MIYWKQRFNLHPATPKTRDRFIDAMSEVLPASEQHGGRLQAAWFANEEWFSQIIHLTEFDDLSALDAWRSAAVSDDALAKGLSRLAELAPERRDDWLEPLGPIPPATLHAAIEASRTDPVGPYTFAILEVKPGQMAPFEAMIDGIRDSLPIIGSWRDVAGNPDRIVDLWKGDMGAAGYRPTNDGQDAFFEPLREIAPRERMVRLHPLPYSPLQ